jgi:hypothetical protein
MLTIGRDHHGEAERAVPSACPDIQGRLRREATPVYHHGAIPWIGISAQYRVFVREIPPSYQDRLVLTPYIP